MSKDKIRYGKTLIICSCLIASSIGVCINSSGVFYTSISKDLGLSQGTVAFSGTLLMLCSAITSLLVTRVMKKMPWKSMLRIASAVSFIATIIIPIIPTTATLYVCSSLRGIAIAFFSAVPVTILMNNWFHKNYGLFTSIVLGCSGITSAVVSPLLVTIINSNGWKMAYLLMGGIQLLLCMPALISHFTFTPQEQLLKPYGNNKQSETIQIQLPVQIEKEKNIIFRICSIIIFAAFVTAIAGVCQHFTNIAVQAHMPYTVTTFIMTAVMLGNISFKFLIGLLSDKIGAFPSSLLMILMNSVAAICMMLSAVPFLFLFGSYLFGAVYSVSAVGIILLIKEMFGVHLYNKLYPIVSFFSNIAMAVSLTLVGFLYDYTGNYDSVFLIVILLQIYNIIFLFCYKSKTCVLSTKLKYVEE